VLDPHFGDTKAMIASAVPPLLWSVYELVKTRRIDAISLTVAGSILLTVGATLMGGSARLIQIRDALVTGAVGVAFLLSLFMARPLIFYLARAAMARTAEGMAAYETIWDQPGIPAIFRWLSVVWGLGLVGQTAAMCYLAWIWPIPRYLLLSPIVSIAIFGVLMAGSLAYLARRPEARAIISIPRPAILHP
jgi:hypothetical protein